MNPQEKENIVEDLLYEASARKYLKENKSGKKKPIVRYLMMAAAAIVLALFIVKLPMGNADTSRLAALEEVYSFPVISKSRSAQTAIVDQHISELNTGNYEFVLDKLAVESPLSEKDAFVKAHIFFEQRKYKELRSHLQSYVFKGQYYKDEISWLTFLINFQEGQTREQLNSSIHTLTQQHQKKAKRLLDSIR